MNSGLRPASRILKGARRFVNWICFSSLREKVWKIYSVGSLKEGYSDHEETASFKVTEKSYNISTRSAELRRMKPAQRSEVSKVVLATRCSRKCGGVGWGGVAWPSGT